MFVKYMGEPIFPFELKPVGYGVEKVVERLSPIEVEILTCVLENNILNESLSYLYDALRRLEEYDIEGSRTTLRNSLEIIKRKFIPSIIVPEESEEEKEFPKRLFNLVRTLQDFLHYGGPHPGPAPKLTTEMIITITIKLIKYLAQSLENNIIQLIK